MMNLDQLAIAWKDGVSGAGGAEPSIEIALEVATRIKEHYQGFTPYDDAPLLIVAYVHGAAYARSRLGGCPDYASNPDGAMWWAGHRFIDRILFCVDHVSFLWQDEDWPLMDEETFNRRVREGQESIQSRRAEKGLPPVEFPELEYPEGGLSRPVSADGYDLEWVRDRIKDRVATMLVQRYGGGPDVMTIINMVTVGIDSAWVGMVGEGPGRTWFRDQVKARVVSMLEGLEGRDMATIIRMTRVAIDSAWAGLTDDAR